MGKFAALLILALIISATLPGLHRKNTWLRYFGGNGAEQARHTKMRSSAASLIKASPALKSVPELIQRLEPASLTEQTDIEREKELRAVLDSGDVCGLVRSRFLDRFSMPELAAALLDAPDLVRHSGREDAVFRSLLLGTSSEDGHETAAHLSGGEEPLIFYNAIFQADLLAGAKNESPDLEEAIRLLESLKSLDPANGAYPYFLAAAKDKAGRSAPEIRAELRSALAAGAFETYQRAFAQRIHEKGLATPSWSVVSTILLAKQPIPDFLPSFRMIKQALKEEGQDFAAQVVSLGQVFMRPAEAHGMYREFVFWSALEYTQGQGFLKLSWPLAHPGQALPEAASGTFRKFYEKYPEPLEWKKLWDSLSDPSQPCPRDKIDRQQQKEREAFLKFWRR
ncbi:MAG: hypothetical protein NDJ89_11245 [Oligoflexia bacterium]|nr:hypothetical protein [Oligoflexia bacterium]